MIIGSAMGFSLAEFITMGLFSLTDKAMAVLVVSTSSSIPVLSLSRKESFLRGPRSISLRSSGRDFFSIDSRSQTCHASSGEEGPTPIVPLSRFFSSSYRNRIALLKPSPSLIVTAVRTILKSLSSSRVLRIAELIKKSLESS